MREHGPSPEEIDVRVDKKEETRTLSEGEDASTELIGSKEERGEQKETAEEKKRESESERTIFELRQKIDAELENVKPQADGGGSEQDAELAPQDMRDTTAVSPAKKAGIRFGKILTPVGEMLRQRVRKFEIESSGIENLRELEGQPCLVVANHLKPKSKLFQTMGLSPDAFVIERVVAEEAGKKLNIISNVTSKIRRVPILGHLDKLYSPFREGVTEGTGFIPVRRDGRFNRNFVRKVEEAVQRREAVLIFPEGHWYEDFRAEHKLETGAATLARMLGLPIVPMYVKGGRSWSKRGKLQVAIGPSFSSGGRSKGEITEQIRKALMKLKEGGAE